MPSSVYFGKKKGEILSISENIKYKYDTMGNICRIDENGEPVVWYKYDALNRLIREDNKTFGKTWLYSYDNKGNILSKRTTNFTLKENAEECEFESVQYEYDGDKLLSYGTEACEYDAIGNPTKYCGKVVAWENGRQMVSYDGTAFTYDGLGRRLSKGNISYTYDSNNRVIKQSNGLEFFYDNTGVAGIEYNNATYLYQKDAQGNICKILDSNGSIIVQYKYDAWGNHAVLDANGADISDAAHIGKLNPYRYRGYYYDTETGLYYLKSRYYDPEVCRFITIDDIAYLDPETVNGLNLYAYCGNNPAMNVDPEGGSWNSFWRGARQVFRLIGRKIKDFFVDDLYGGIIKPAWDWISGTAAPAVGDFFTKTLLDWWSGFKTDAFWWINDNIRSPLTNFFNQLPETIGSIKDWWKNLKNDIGLWLVKNMESVGFWSESVVGIAGLIVSFIPGLNVLGIAFSLAGVASVINNIYRRYS